MTTTVSLSLPRPPAAPLCTFPTFKHPTVMNMAVADFRNAKPLDRPDNTDINDEISSDEDDFDGGMWIHHPWAHSHASSWWCALVHPTPPHSLPICATFSILYLYLSRKYYCYCLLCWGVAYHTLTMPYVSATSRSSENTSSTVLLLLLSYCF